MPKSRTSSGLPPSLQIAKGPCQCFLKVGGKKKRAPSFSRQLQSPYLWTQAPKVLCSFSCESIKISISTSDAVCCVVLGKVLSPSVPFHICTIGIKGCRWAIHSSCPQEATEPFSDVLHSGAHLGVLPAAKTLEHNSGMAAPSIRLKALPKRGSSSPDREQGAWTAQKSAPPHLV